MSRRAFKTDVSFLEKISAGATGTTQVFVDLKRQGHSPIELERGSMSFKIWKKIKIKRVRVPDILCVRCGIRVESRAKTDLQVTMSHSISDPMRGWDFGLTDGDFIARARDEKEHIYIRLESACSLLKIGNKESVPFFEKLLCDQYLENRLECVIVLGEIDQGESSDLLIKTLLDTKQHPEIRAGAAWSLGELKDKKALNALMMAFDAVEKEIRVEAARAMAKLNELFSQETVKLIPASNDSQRAGISWSLSKSGNFTIHDLLAVMNSVDARRWIAWIIGTQKEQRYISQMEELKQKDKEVYFAVTVLWKVLSSWVNGVETY